MNITVNIQQHDFSFSDEYEALAAHSNGDGAVVTFVGKVRQQNQGNHVLGLNLEHYPLMTEKAITDIAQKACNRWPIAKVAVIHRIGNLNVGDQIVFVGVSSAHREAAFSASQFIMDYLKNQAPFWKKERTLDGDVWVKSNLKDKQALTRWQV